MKYKRPSKLEYKTVKIEVKEFREDDKYFYFEAYLSTFDNVDRGDDAMVKGCFIESLKEIDPALLAFHNPDEPVGIFEKVFEDDIGLYVHGKMPKKDVYVSGRIIPQMEVGSIKSMSIGYSIADYNKDMEIIDGVRYLKKVTLWEGSLVTIPMNPEARIKSAVPFQDDIPIGERTRPWDSTLALGRVRDWSGAEDGGLEDPEVQDKYKRAFLWFDDDAPELFGSYKLPVGDIVAETLTIIPRAIFSAAAALQGARGGVFIPGEDRPRVMRTVEKYYEKMGMESPFDGKTFRIDDIDSLTKRQLERLFHKGVRVSQEVSKELVSIIKSDNHRDGDLDQNRDGEEDDWSSVLESIKSIK